MLALVLAAARAGAPAPRAHQVPQVLVPAGSYEPLYAPAGASRVPVASFRIDREPVTRGAFEAFVRRHPEWRRGTIRAVYTDPGYLADWPSATDAGAHPGRAVTDVSWFAAKAFCEARGGRLPTTAEWEYVAAASPTRRDAHRDQAHNAELLALYSSRAERARRDVGEARVNAFGVAGLHDRVWEWTADFNSVLVASDSRSLGAGGDERDHHLFCATAAIGATDPTNYAAFLRYAFRAGLTGRSTTHSLGFRCATGV
jgi:formylglycine-generating enzyme required for sulfatase activity